MISYTQQEVDRMQIEDLRTELEGMRREIHGLLECL